MTAAAKPPRAKLRESRVTILDGITIVVLLAAFYAIAVYVAR